MEKKISDHRSKTLPSSPTHSSSSSSEFEFRISISPQKSSAALCPADELFFNGQLLPLHLSAFRSTLTASTDTARDSTGSSSSSSFPGDSFCDSSRPSSATDDDELKRLTATTAITATTAGTAAVKSNKPKYFSLARFSHVFRKDQPFSGAGSGSGSGSSVKEKFRKYLKKVKPLYEKLSQKHQHEHHHHPKKATASATMARSASNTVSFFEKQTVAQGNNNNNKNYSFSGNLRVRRGSVGSCPSSMRSSPSHSGVLSRSRAGGVGANTASFGSCSGDSSTMEELQSAIQGAIAHCKNSMMMETNKITAVSHEV